MIDLDDLRCFEAGAVHLNFRAAARQVGLSPAAFSDRIRRLEDSLGTALFARSTRRVQITPAGERLLPQARKTLAEVQQCADLLREGGPAPYTLTIGTRFELGMSWVLPAVEEQAKLRPEQTLHLYFSEGPAIVDALEGGHLDAIIGSMRMVSPRIQTMPLHEERYCFVASPELLAERPSRDPRMRRCTRWSTPARPCLCFVTGRTRPLPTSSGHLVSISSWVPSRPFATGWLRVVGLRFCRSTSSPTTLRRADSSAC